jgi:hypothetical protein
MKFTIRDLFLVTVIVALVLGWWVDRSRVNGRLTRELEWRSSLEQLHNVDPERKYFVEHLEKTKALAKKSGNP